MPDLLNYQPSNSAVYYTPPKRVAIGRTVLAFVVAAVLAAGGGFLYGRIQPHLSSFALRGGAVAAAGLATGVLGLLAVHFGRVRIPVVAALLGALLGLIALAAMWLSWVRDVLLHMGFRLSYLRLATRPVALFRLIGDINDYGTWTYNRQPVRGFPLLVFWLGEAGIVLAGGVLMPLKGLFSEDPVCRECGRRCRYTPGLPRFAIDRENEFQSAIHNRQFDALATHTAAAHEDDPEISVHLMSCPGCDQTHVLTVNRIAWYLDANRRPTVKTVPLVKQLLITPAEATRLKAVLKHVRAEREAAAEATAHDASAATPVPTIDEARESDES